ncbi:MAG: hypothetical protein MJY70_02660 [Bacteroidales bacterium]|nr:hypothetical protein [Bacteroidales bacterium]
MKVKPFPEKFDYWGKLVHGRYAGWTHLEYEGCSDPELVNRIWSLSDVVSFESRQGHAETGWLASICFRYGRPIFCTRWECPDEGEIEETLERFSISHVFWYSAKPLNGNSVSSFRFRPVVTEQVTDE